MPIEIIGDIELNSDVGMDANSYASLADYKAILGIDPHKDISDQTDEQIAQALIYATFYLDGQIQDKVLGRLYDKTYALLFPRIGLVDYRGVRITDYTVFPDQLIKATVYQAWWITQKDVSAPTAQTSGVKKKQMEGLGNIEYFSPSQQATANRVQRLAKEVPALLDSFISGSLGGNVQVMLRG